MLVRSEETPVSPQTKMREISNRVGADRVGVTSHNFGKLLLSAPVQRKKGAEQKKAKKQEKKKKKKRRKTKKALPNRLNAKSAICWESLHGGLANGGFRYLSTIVHDCQR